MISKHIPDLIKVKEIEEKILSVLTKESEHEVEGDLLEILNYDHFDLIKLIKQFRCPIYYLTILAKSSNKEETKAEILKTE